MNYTIALREIRCENNSEHRIEAAKYLLENFNNSDRIAYLINCVLYDPEEPIRSQVKQLLYEIYGSELDSIIKVEGMDGTPIEEPWMIPCSKEKKDLKIASILPKYDDVESMVTEKDIEGLNEVLRDPYDALRRANAVQALLKCHNEGSPEMLARAVLHDPNENVQQQAYQALYELIGAEKAESLLEKIGALSMDEEESWLLEPDIYEQYVHSQENHENEQDASPFGINKSDLIRGLTNLFTAEKDPQKRKQIIDALDESNDFNVNNAIARVGLFDADNEVQDYAKSVLANRLGENLDAFLEHVNETASPFLSDLEEDDEDEEEIEVPSSFSKNDEFSSQINAQEPAVQEGSTFNPMVLVAGLVVLALVLYLILR